MKTFIAVLLLGIYLHTTTASFASAGCAKNLDSSTTHLLAKIPVIGRKLLQNWKSCGEEERTRIKGNPLVKFKGYKAWRKCCVKCKKTKSCVSWSHNSKKQNCKLFGDDDSLEKVDGKKHHTAGVLRWRL